MHVTIDPDDALIKKARALTGTKETAALPRQALETLIRVESGRKLAELGGSMPEADAAPRHRHTGT